MKYKSYLLSLFFLLCNLATNAQVHRNANSSSEASSPTSSIIYQNDTSIYDATSHKYVSQSNPIVPLSQNVRRNNGTNGVLSGCGTGTFSYTNCQGTTITIDRANMTPNTYIALGFGSSGGWPFILGYIDGGCNISGCIVTYCVKESLHTPVPGAGGQYGLIQFTPTNNYTAYGYTELQLEQINWIYCNSWGASGWDVATAIWEILVPVRFPTNSLAISARNAVPTVVGGDCFANDFMGT